MGMKKGGKKLTPKQRERVKYIIAPRLKYRDTNEEILERLEDNGFTMSLETLIIIKREMRECISDRFKEIAEFELAEEHNYALEMMKVLMKTMLNSVDKAENQSEKVRISAEIRAIQRDLIDYYGSSDIVEAVFRHFNEGKEEEKTKKAKDVK
jgi:hypothetical protein